jgi:hypothetical protein
LRRVLALLLVAATIGLAFPACESFQSNASNCVLAGDPCVGDGDCCGGHCADGNCDGSTYPNGYYCTQPTDCDSDICDSTHTCVCAANGQSCIRSPGCCSGYCGFDEVCGPCMPGGVCQKDSDCCGGGTCDTNGGCS